ncbi:hypothetical protein B0T14DRAFT_567376 [Immersiella caudata]|uniref:Uncharacterized protein n=1 Tax=Immersiella caudata TaxID=314043 RepID=A0AA39WS88_9PEZI|nr:hypothetical protein B0T14DRAFT_567376 [Immersiella caudata]
MNLGQSNASMAPAIFNALAPRNSSNLQRLTALQVEGARGFNVGPHLLALLQAAPNLKALYLDKFDTTSLEPIQPHLFANVTHLSLGLFGVLSTTSVLSGMIDGCERLEMFHLHLARIRTTEISHNLVNLLTPPSTFSSTFTSNVSSPGSVDHELFTPTSAFFRRGFAGCPNLRAIGLNVPSLRRRQPNFATSPSLFLDLLPSSLKQFYFNLAATSPSFSASLPRTLGRAKQSGRFPDLEEVAINVRPIDLERERAVKLKELVDLWRTRDPGFTFLVKRRFPMYECY